MGMRVIAKKPLRIANRFVIRPSNISGTIFMVILSDWMFWKDHIEELDTWCAANDAVRHGSVIAMDESGVAFFTLKWA